MPTVTRNQAEKIIGIVTNYLVNINSGANAGIDAVTLYEDTLTQIQAAIDGVV